MDGWRILSPQKKNNITSVKSLFLAIHPKLSKTIYEWLALASTHFSWICLALAEPGSLFVELVVSEAVWLWPSLVINNYYVIFLKQKSMHISNEFDNGTEIRQIWLTCVIFLV